MKVELNLNAEELELLKMALYMADNTYFANSFDAETEQSKEQWLKKFKENETLEEKICEIFKTNPIRY